MLILNPTLSLCNAFFLPCQNNIEFGPCIYICIKVYDLGGKIVLRRINYPIWTDIKTRVKTLVSVNEFVQCVPPAFG